MNTACIYETEDEYGVKRYFIDETETGDAWALDDEPFSTIEEARQACKEANDFSLAYIFLR